MSALDDTKDKSFVSYHLKKLNLLRKHLGIYEVLDLFLSPILLILAIISIGEVGQSICHAYTKTECEAGNYSMAFTLSIYDKDFQVQVKILLCIISLLTNAINVYEYVVMSEENFEDVKDDHHIQKFCFSVGTLTILIIITDITVEEDRPVWIAQIVFAPISIVMSFCGLVLR